MSERATRRGPRKDPERAERRREEILDAAAVVFARDGYQDADLQEVADALKLAKGTLYLYFASKEELFLAAVDRGMRLLHKFVLGAYAGVADPLDRLTTAIRAYLEFFKVHREHAELLIQERATFRDRKAATYFEHKRTNAGEWQETFADLIRDGRVRDVPVDRIMDVVSDLVYGTMFTNHFSGRHKPLDAQARDIIDVVFFGILTRAERVRREGERLV
jgi:AcrR family transcriptional regulator